MHVRPPADRRLRSRGCATGANRERSDARRGAVLRIWRRRRIACWLRSSAIANAVHDVVRQLRSASSMRCNSRTLEQRRCLLNCSIGGCDICRECCGCGGRSTARRPMIRSRVSLAMAAASELTVDVEQLARDRLLVRGTTNPNRAPAVRIAVCLATGRDLAIGNVLVDHCPAPQLTSQTENMIIRAPRSRCTFVRS